MYSTQPEESQWRSYIQPNCVSNPKEIIIFKWKPSTVKWATKGPLDTSPLKTQAENDWKVSESEEERVKAYGRVLAATVHDPHLSLLSMKNEVKIIYLPEGI